MSSASEESQSSCRRPPSRSTSSEEPTFTTMRRKSVTAGGLRDIWGILAYRGAKATTIVAARRCLTCAVGSAPRPGAQTISHEHRRNWHVRLDLRGLAWAVLPARCGEEKL